jgi:ferric-dicitrate binding protein FerR (iron transport regulator)
MDQPLDLSRALQDFHSQSPANAAVLTLLAQLLSEVEALREALASPQTPESVRTAYRQAYARTAVSSHNAAGIAGPIYKLIKPFFPGGDDRFAPEMAMMQRLGATPKEQQALREEMETVEQYT